MLYRVSTRKHKKPFGGIVTLRVILATPFTKSHRTAEETLALGYLASVLREANYDVEIIDGWLESLSLDDMVARVTQGEAPAAIGMSCYRSNIEQAVALMQALRKRIGKVPMFCGGYGPTFHSEVFVKEGFDVAVIGEAEHIIERLVDTLVHEGDLESIPGIAYNDQGKIVTTRREEPWLNLDTIPLPARDTVEFAKARKNFVHICTSRGCGAYCNFCSIAAFAVGGSRTARWRGRSVRDIVDEIEMLHRAHGVAHFKIVDDSFIEPPRDEQWAEAFRDELARRQLDIRFRTQVRADRLTPELVKTLAEAGWFSTAVGIENAAPTALQRMLKQADAAANEAALKMLETNGVYVQMGMILFDPYTTMEELEINLHFLRRNRWPFTKGIFTEMFAAEGTPFTRQLGARGLLLGSATSQNYHYQVQDPQVQRVYQMLKSWHRSHSKVYDWVIDALTAPKVLLDELFTRNHRLCQRLQRLDLKVFETVLHRVNGSEPEGEDDAFIAELISKSVFAYTAIEREIAKLYAEADMQYDAVVNPFLGTANDGNPA